MPETSKVAVAPSTAPAWVTDAVLAGGGEIVDVNDADGLMWFAMGPDGLREILDDTPSIRWVGLPAAGIEAYLSVLDPARTWTAAKGVYAEPCAEHALALMLACFRSIPQYARRDSWSPAIGRHLYDASVTIVGAGGIALALVDLLKPFRCDVTLVRRKGRPDAVDPRMVGTEELSAALATADVVVLAPALTPATHGLIGPEQLAAMRSDAWLVNIGRGGLVVTDALVDALQTGAIGGAALDVTDPEPLPTGHPLWKLDNCIITPHTANPPVLMRPLLERHITTNVRSFVAGEPLTGIVDVGLGY
jgi:phosphoglycerate dehydrogenase-like enzyme